MVKIGINGFGRLGRLLLRVGIKKCMKKCDSSTPRIVMVNDPLLNPDIKKNLFVYDTFQEHSNLDMIETGSTLTIEGQRVEFSSECIVEKIPWQKCQVDFIIDTTGKHVTCEKASKFLTEGIKRVLVTGCSKVPMFVVGVNHSCFDPAMNTLSAANMSLNCLMCLLRVLHENFDVKEASVTEILPMTNEYHILDDSRQTSYRQCRSAIMNYTPAPSLTENNNVAKIMPELERKTVSTAIRVPAPCVGAIDCTVKFGNEASQDVINCRLKEASETHMKGLIRYSAEELVSSDIIGDPHSCIVDCKAGVSLSKCTAKFFAWYDSEFALANRLYELANYVASREHGT